MLLALLYLSYQCISVYIYQQHYCKNDSLASVHGCKLWSPATQPIACRAKLDFIEAFYFFYFLFSFFEFCFSVFVLACSTNAFCQKIIY